MLMTCEYQMLSISEFWWLTVCIHPLLLFIVKCKVKCSKYDPRHSNAAFLAFKRQICATKGKYCSWTLVCVSHICSEPPSHTFSLIMTYFSRPLPRWSRGRTCEGGWETRRGGVVGTHQAAAQSSLPSQGRTVLLPVLISPHFLFSSGWFLSFLWSPSEVSLHAVFLPRDVVKKKKKKSLLVFADHYLLLEHRGICWYLIDRSACSPVPWAGWDKCVNVHMILYKVFIQIKNPYVKIETLLEKKFFCILTYLQVKIKKPFVMPIQGEISWCNGRWKF